MYIVQMTCSPYYFKTILSHAKLCAFRCLISRPQILYVFYFSFSVQTKYQKEFKDVFSFTFVQTISH